MDSHEQTTRALALDPAHAARVVRAIANIESDYLYAQNALSERFMREAGVVVRHAAPEPWEIESTEFELSLSAPNWKSRGFHDAWLELTEIATDQEEHTWIAAAVGTDNTKMCFELTFRPALEGAWNRSKGDAAALAPLIKAGFQQSTDGTRLYLAITVNGEALAKGFELNDFDKALAPVRTAAAKAVAAKPALDTFIDYLRAGGKKN